MGYRFYLSKIKNKKLREISICKNEKELADFLGMDYNEEEYNNVMVWDLSKTIDQVSDDVHEINMGKKRNMVFDNKELNDHFNQDWTLFKINKKDLLKLIKIYEVNIIKHLTNKKKEIEERNPDEAKAIAITEFNYRLNEWEYLGVLNLDKKEKDRICSSWSYEYNIFDLVHLYKTFNFRKNSLIIYAY
jgi:hypothetical protein